MLRLKFRDTMKLIEGVTEKTSLLIVDDSRTHILSLTDLFKHDYQLLVATNCQPGTKKQASLLWHIGIFLKRCLFAGQVLNPGGEIYEIRHFRLLGLWK